MECLHAVKTFPCGLRNWKLRIGNDILETLVNVTVSTQSKVSADKVCYYKYKEVNCSKTVGKKQLEQILFFILSYEHFWHLL
jgi:hypothetical protein